MKTPLFAALTLIACGCATQTDPDEAVTASELIKAADDEPRIVCTREKRTGSNRLVKVCREVANEVDRENTRRDMQVLKRQSDILSTPQD
ncbi:MAG: hypothetical protein AAFN50_08490 [Pseudomonadota bacterium]